MTTRVTLHIPEPRAIGKARPLHNTRTGKVYTPTTTRQAEQRIRDAWTHAGSPRLPNTPLKIIILTVEPRPKDHHRTDGTLTPKGHRTPYPARRPDFDNIAKLACDALNKRAYNDDAQIVDGHVHKRWMSPLYPVAGTHITIEAI